VLDRPEKALTCASQTTTAPVVTDEAWAETKWRLQPER